MNAEFQLIEDLLHTYAEGLLVPVCLTDADGNVKIISPKSVELQYEKVREQATNHFNALLNNTDYNLRELKHTLLYEETVPGIKCVIAPIPVSGRSAYFLWAGPLIVQGREQSAAENIVHEGTERFVSAIRTLIDSARETDPKEIRQVHEKMNKLARTLSLLLDSGTRKATLLRRIETARERFEPDKKAQLFSSAVLETLAQTSTLADVFGVALRSGAEQFNIAYAAGESASNLLNQKFHAGEGFLGQAVLSHATRTWKEIEGDPRQRFFTQKGMPEAKQLYTFPIHANGRLEGVLFALGLHESGEDDVLVAFEQLDAAFMAMTIGTHMAHKDLSKQLNRLKPVNEVARMMLDMPDAHNLLITMVDVCLSFVEYPRAAIMVMHDPLTGKVRTVGRGIEAKKIESRAREIGLRYFTESIQKPASPQIHRTEEPYAVIEIPILLGERAAAVLTVEVDSIGENEINNELTNSLALLGSMVVKSIVERAREAELKNSVADTLHESLRFGRANSYDKSEKAARLMAEYAEFVGMAEADTELLLRVCKLIHQDTRQLRGLKGLYEQEVTLIEQYLQLSSEDAPSLASSYPPRVHLLAAVQTYIQFGEKSWQAKIPHLNAQAIEPFRNFLLNRTVHARELLLVPPPFTDSPLPLDDRSSKKIFEEVAEEKGLTVREKEVLELVVRAMNNKQIGKHLFISEHTVKNHLTNIFIKLGVSDRAKAIAYVYYKSIS